MQNHRVPCACAALFALAASGSAVGADKGRRALEPPLPLRVVERTPIPDLNGPFAWSMDPVCDADSNVFMFPMVAGRDGVINVASGHVRILKISPDGKTVVELKPDAVPGYEKSSIRASALGLDDHLYVLVTEPKKYQDILEFDGSGKYQGAASFDRSIAITRFAVFASREFLLTGYDTKGKASTGIFNGRGQLIRSVALGNGQPVSGVLPPPGRFEPAKDGNIYFAGTGVSGSLMGVSPSGEVVAKIGLTAPKGAEMLVSAKAASGRLAIEYAGRTDRSGTSHPGWVSVYDLSSGEKLADYSLPPRESSLLCYRISDVQGDVFTFLGTSGEYALVHAAR